jgi:hypothetical protein
LRRLCFPSLLHRCGAFEVAGAFDLSVCVQVGIAAWMAATRKTIDEFPEIVKVARLIVGRPALLEREVLVPRVSCRCLSS